MRATPPSARIMAGTRSRAMTDVAPASSAMRACSTFITSMMTPPLSISARPTFRRRLVAVKLLFSLFRHGLRPRFGAASGPAARDGKPHNCPLFSVAAMRIVAAAWAE